MANKSSNKNLHRASQAKKDEFYTQLTDIEKELKHYKDQFRGKVVFCNCNDPYESDFFKYFAMKFNFLGLKKLIATCYTGSPIVGTQLPLFGIENLAKQNIDTKHLYKAEITEVRDENADGAIDLADVEYLLKHDKNTLTSLNGDGDFRSSECIDLLKEADIVVTNPPFSLFREYVAQLMKHNKKFLIIGNLNAITYKEVFKLIKENKLWLGHNNGPKTYLVPGDYKQNNIFVDTDGKKYAKMGNTGWFTNLDVEKRHEDMILYKTYKGNEDKYPKYDNYEAINIDKTADIPMDYNGVMGVPISFLDKHNPEQFEIIWTTDRGGDGMLEDIKLPHTRYDAPVVNGKGLYKRILIRHKKVKK